jgi:hypothetical protein
MPKPNEHRLDRRRSRTITTTMSKCSSPSITKMVLLVLSVLALNIVPSQSFSAAPATSASGSPSSETNLPSEEDVVRDQLGYLPSNYVGVSAWRTTKSKQRIPVAIQTYPLNGGAKRRQNKAKLSAPSESSTEESSSTEQPIVQSPFPTLFWLTCPEISRAVANLERGGFVQIFEDELNSRPDLAKNLFLCHEEYARLRWKSLTEEDRNVLASSSSSSPLTPSLQRMRNMMECSGISGTNFTDISSWDKDYFQRLEESGGGSAVESSGVSVSGAGDESSLLSFLSTDVDAKVPPIKCLHAHYAHYRSTVSVESTKYINPVGELIHKQLALDFPDLDL